MVHIIISKRPHRANMCADNITVCQRFTSLSVHVKIKSDFLAVVATSLLIPSIEIRIGHRC